MTKNNRLGRWLSNGGIRTGRYSRVIQRAGREAERFREMTDAELTRAAESLLGDPRRERDRLVDFVALGREAAERAVGLRPFDVQLTGALWMMAGTVVEMDTGEGKTLAGALAASGFALRGRSVHVVSVNDYLARRDAEWMGPLYELLGVSVGWIGAESTPDERREAYSRRVVYGSVSEFGFDVLRDNLCTDPDELVTGDVDVALVDEADSVLVDEARVPLILAGSVETGTALERVTEVVSRLRPGRHYRVDEAGRDVHLTRAGERAVEKAYGGIDLYDADQNGAVLTEVNLALHARALLRRDVDYIVRDGRVELVDASRGRVAKLQRWPDGLQAAVEAKEAVAATDSGEVLDTVSVQGLIQRYPMLCGMTGTAMPAEEQFRRFYNLSVVPLPPNRPCVRDDEPDRFYQTAEDRDEAVVAHIVERHETGQPILIGTLDVAESQRLADRLTEAGVGCVVLNAKNDADEAKVIASAGRLGAVTVSTQIAGRGTDIRLGGPDGTEHDEVVALGGLHVVGTGHHSSKRVDDQLRGRAGRQGDPGSSVFFASLEDDLITRHVPGLSGPGDLDGRITSPRVAVRAAHAQRIAEGLNLDQHSLTWQYHRLLEHQRTLVVEERDRLLHTDAAVDRFREAAPDGFEELSAQVSETELARAARLVWLHQIDRHWVDHLAVLADLRETIHLRVLGRQRPVDEFHREAIRAFQPLISRAEAAAVETMESVTVRDDRIDVAAAGVARPSATWTYLVTDNPFGTALERDMRGMRSRFGGGNADDADD
ncbi:protein translocase subunit secA [Stackebrandtia albiflava]|uniref:Protein translocase subunit SecA n=2 Tax=Stackebrandtia albiflava TaxID=406432 RepID=A0A562VDV3_9ACTN|nr:accessory Sec system translocase SecA2 [Stackebrandtia albiflava]TWJ16060.1 protein translocase subunit secA [Stackebrandtia albiflava]